MCVTTSTASMTSSNVQTNQVDSCLIMDMLNQLPRESHLPILSELFSTCVSLLFKLSLPKDFLCLAANAMVQLSNGGRTNVLYNLAKGMGTLRPDKKDSRFPIKQMPMGLVEYTAQFFAFDNLQQVKQNANDILLNFSYRYLVQWIIVCGYRPCIATLERNGSSYIVDLCGA